MKDWFKRNWKQMLVLILSTGDFVVMHYHPEWHDWEALIAAFLATQGIRQLPITWTNAHATKVANKALLQVKYPVEKAEEDDHSSVIPNLEKPFQDSHNHHD